MFTQPKTLPETHIKRLASYHRDAVPIDEESRAHHDLLIRPIRLLNVVEPDCDYFPFVESVWVGNHRKLCMHADIHEANNHKQGRLG